MAKLYVFNGLALEAGPQFGFVVEEAIDFGSTERELYDDNRNDFDLSLGLGASLKFSKFFVYGRYNAGLTDIYDVEGVEAKNSVIQAGVGLLF
jgi:hypothetical protein